MRTRRPAAFAFLSMALAALLTTVLAIPAQAVERDASSGLPPNTAASAGPAQSLAAGNVLVAAIARDGYSVGQAPASVANIAAAGPAVRWPFPTATRLSDGFGPRASPCAGCSSFHKGLDLLPGEGTPVHAIADGVVREVSAYDDGGLGVHVVLDHTIDGRLVSSVYAHFQEGSLAVAVGQAVSAGDELGAVGTTGQSTGPHLHLEILLDGVTPTDPFAWLTERAGPQ
ncbi:murein DD-endopeptidase MepM/ murein hydrolase activator NlpD [Cryobacterium sp. MP_M5]|uniref:M23 family metallopeptidase n=1 Tax=unclassified Cryobacterium TaxID=2649013 RepID=UPI0018C9C718|nr:MULTISPECIES: M23 family metallopeptidase [unclassified Cryobacterium]MBG6056829.1 murein DD-endopeptidase MepM/ murein hydrolase activator NlpD [Cryobacterium sp. MP_M3]MEC5175029.1 murein DD-endopeptidase MepM/ murein hydrolase activator NlpD [Cryobacterium sp. MP_M5]